ncbi:serine/threonine-protein kinase [Oscillatoria sp. FACHB-1406]|uniref:serine/threonine-protein kinase n=1 Tax=Oscillatoria sp. FACHB-1406 TaxID=2692846 RepID=UPI00168992AB|nr:serine/threonine-protein kinase [Oscillatoria sp. FACHB-1406]MBD2576421.1 serine/threonine protein kinase [Oscillatoria sp. FACHB-1406]
MTTEQILENRYRIIRSLGSGGFGETYLAEDLHMPSARRCVIKQLKPIAHNPTVHQLVQERFAREAAILEELGNSHPQIPSLYAYFESNGKFYLVQEWIEGETLTNKLMREKTITESAAIEILCSLLPVLDYVHYKRIIHRDIKPDNIILRNRDNSPVLIDFGAVKEIMGTTITTSGNGSSSIIIGTPGFMPSEQAIGRPMFASDLYSLGLTAIYLLTGKIPQEISTDPVTGTILWRQYAPTVSATLAAILDKVIQPHPRDRYQSAREMLDALQPLAIDLPFPTTVLPSQSPQFLPTITSFSQSPVSTSSPPEQLSSTGLNNWQKAGIAGSVMGIFLTGGLVLNQSKTRNFNYINKQPQEFYFVADDAYSNINFASERVENLQRLGYQGAGMFWIREYPNLSGKNLLQVYPAKFVDRDSCAKFIESYRLRNPESYCVFGSKNPAANPDRF